MYMSGHVKPPAPPPVALGVEEARWGPLPWWKNPPVAAPSALVQPHLPQTGSWLEANYPPAYAGGVHLTSHPLPASLLPS